MLKVFIVLNKDDILQHFYPNKSILEKKKKLHFFPARNCFLCLVSQTFLYWPFFPFFNGKKTTDIFLFAFWTHV